MTTGKQSARPRRDDDPMAPMILVIAVLGAILVFVTVIALEAYFYKTEGEETASKSYSQVPEDLARLRAAQEEELGAYRWVDSARGVAAIPIDRAMELVVRDQGHVAAGTLKSEKKP